MSNNWGHFVPGSKESLNRAEKIRFKKKLCKSCGKELPIFHGQQLYHPECLPRAPKKKRWR